VGTRVGPGVGAGDGGRVGRELGDEDGRGVGAGVGSDTCASSNVEGSATSSHLEVAVARLLRPLLASSSSATAEAVTSSLEQQLLPTAAGYRGRTKRACARADRCSLKLLPSLVSNSSASAFRT
jgi:hypothetical protein